MKISLQKIAYTLVIIILSVVILREGGPVLKPLAFSLIAISICLKPVQWLERVGFNRFWSVISVLVLASVLFVSIGYFIGSQTVQVIKTLKSEVNITNPSSELAETINEKLPGDIFHVSRSELVASSKRWLSDVGLPLIGNTFKTTSQVISSGILSLIYTFLLLFYRRGIAEVLVSMGSEHVKRNKKMLTDLLKTGYQYIAGLSLVIIILSVLYAITFSLFGLDFPLVFAGIAALLAIIPYVGTTLGASLPVIYAYLTYDNHFIALGLIACIMTIQMFEGNILTPKIVGGSMELNPLAALLAVVIGNFIWGLAGMVLFLPLVAMARVVFEKTENLKSLAALSGKSIGSSN